MRHYMAWYALAVLCGAYWMTASPPTAAPRRTTRMTPLRPRTQRFPARPACCPGHPREPEQQLAGTALAHSRPPGEGSSR
ncbi:hypothetical protein [Streptomyces sp. RK75]|uniref:hypothetical protein n=1 Tax=Streptomyces sp. RK75 TaxID=2824895 RepID=UPI001B37521A|nr:hypothetical protein [Streptomyces sp. RK75]MBQ0867350.1 hypothetical protein [Streptomyces sp. RK75]